MELKDTSPTKKFDEKEIKCPYCFKIFHHHEVGFRAEPVSQKIIEEYRHKITEVDIDEETAKEYTVKLENAQKYEKQRDDIWLNYWLGKGWAENGALYENEEGYDEHTEPGRDSILTEQQEVVITPGSKIVSLIINLQFLAGDSCTSFSYIIIAYPLVGEDNAVLICIIISAACRNDPLVFCFLVIGIQEVGFAFLCPDSGRTCLFGTVSLFVYIVSTYPAALCHLTV